MKVNALLLLLLVCFFASPAWSARQKPALPLTVYEKIGGLWRANKMLYCNRAKAARETAAEILLLKEIRTARVNTPKAEIEFQLRDGSRGSIDLQNRADKTPAELTCLD